VALFFMPVLTILLSDLKGHEIASGSGTSTFLYQLGASFAASIITFLWDSGAARQHAQLAAHVNAYNPALRDSAVLHLAHGQMQSALAQINAVITQQGLQLSFNHLMHGLGFILIALIALLLLAKPPFAARAR
jgi:DHA2 family multidrug resistance protein